MGKFLLRAVLVSTIILAILVAFTLYMFTREEKLLIEKVDYLSREVTDGWELYDKTLDRLIAKEEDYDMLLKKYNEELWYKLTEEGWMWVHVTGYTIDDLEGQGTTNINSSDWNLHDARFSGLPSCAVDFSIFPQYSFLEIKGLGVYVAADQGEKIMGLTREGFPKIDILCPDEAIALRITGDYLARVLEKGITIE